MSRRLLDPIEEIKALRREINQLKSDASLARRLAWGGQFVVFTTSGNFIKANYPGLKAVFVQMVGGGGAGGGAVGTPGSGNSSVGYGGGGGAYAEKYIDESALGASEFVTVGSGGVGVSASTGGGGGTSAFGAHVSADGGFGGTVTTTSSTTIGTAQSTNGANPNSSGDFEAPGGASGPIWVDPGQARGGQGGSSFLSPADWLSAGTVGQDGPNARADAYGCGGMGGSNQQTASNQPRTGGNGAPGVVIVRLIF